MSDRKLFGRKDKGKLTVPSYIRPIDGGVGVDMDELIRDKDFREAVEEIGKLPLDNSKSKDKKN